MTTSGERRPVSLVTALAEAEELQTVSGTTPGETVAIIECLLAICYAAGIHPEDTEEWVEWVRTRHPLDEAATWLRNDPGTWNMFDRLLPLWQNAHLAPFIDEHGCGPAQLVLEHSGDYLLHFDKHHLEYEHPLRPAEAFRATLVQHCYAPGTRGRVPGNLPGLGPALNNLATTRLSSRIRVLALGDTLADTLRLNLAPCEMGKAGTFNRSWTQRQRRPFDRKPNGRTPDGPADLHSILGRSILLRPVRAEDGSIAVDRVLIGAGELLAPLPATYLQDAVLVPKGTTSEMAPLQPSVRRALWRQSHALYAAVAQRTMGSDLYSRLASISERRILLWAVGLATDQNKIATWISDTFPFVPGREQELHRASETGSQVAEYLGTALRAAAHTAWTLAYPSAKPADKAHQMARFDASAEHYAAAANPFHELLDAIAEGRGVEDAGREYAGTLRRSAHRLLGLRLASLPKNSRGFRARAAAEHRFASELTSTKAPSLLQKAPRP
ncbi:type I-E CRISPR-associated protein Cse1/CasA [Nocardia higoensis]|uniref:Type I-E CRISPR-associated protein Cse1/CasA n=1 Tax=Nocardia higoensis TaxID=228599 RepID=A0ABS0DEX3_9NOCA|nr:type I-E CRISPR-associated protein Cse1/CasA [Nocardia higoensis]